MKHVLYLCAMMLLCLGLGSCTSDEILESAGAADKTGTFTAYLPASTRTYHNGLKTYWQEQDKIALYSVSAIDTDASPVVYSIENIDDDGSAVFRGPALDPNEQYTAMYPYVEGKTLSEAKDYILENQNQVGRYGSKNLANTDILIAENVSAETEVLQVSHGIALVQIRTVASRISAVDGVSVRGPWGDRVYYLGLSSIGSTSDVVDVYIAVPPTKPWFFGEIYTTYYKNGEASPAKYTMPSRVSLSAGQILTVDLTTDSWATQTATGLPHYDCDGVKNGHEYVEVAGIKWACSNVGAMFPWETGGYYAWGETATKVEYTDENYPFTGMSEDELRTAGVIDENMSLTPLYDVASVKWGGRWQMPTLGQLKALVANEDAERIQAAAAQMNERWGVSFEDAYYTKSMFLQCLGFRALTYTFSSGGGGYYWSKDLRSSDVDNNLITSYCLTLNANSMENRDSEQQSRNGMFIRPVLLSE